MIIQHFLTIMNMIQFLILSKLISLHFDRKKLKCTAKERGEWLDETLTFFERGYIFCNKVGRISGERGVLHDKMIYRVVQLDFTLAL